jgi:hypothetical protein
LSAFDSQYNVWKNQTPWIPVGWEDVQNSLEEEKKKEAEFVFPSGLSGGDSAELRNFFLFLSKIVGALNSGSEGSGMLLL